MNDLGVITALAQGKSALQAKGVQHLALFGSYARGDAGEYSNLDVLIDIVRRCRSSRLSISQALQTF